MKKIFGILICAVMVCACSSDTKLFKKARLAQTRGNYPKALALYNQLLKQKPDYPAALTNRGLVWEKMPAKDAAEKAKNRQYAQEDYLRALEINPNQAETYNNLGALYMDMNLNGDAIDNFTEAIAINPNYFQAILNRATAYSKTKNYVAAIRDFDRAAALRPHDTAMLYNRALAYYEFERYESAVNDLSHAIAASPNNARLYVARARCFVKMGYPADAYDDLTQAINLQPDYAMAYYYIADLLYRNGDTDYALGALVKAKELASNYAPTYDLMGDMLAMEDPVSATANYLVAQRLDPKNARKYQAKLNAMKTTEGRYQVVSARFFPAGRKYNSSGERRVATRPIPTGVQAQRARVSQKR